MAKYTERTISPEASEILSTRRTPAIEWALVQFNSGNGKVHGCRRTDCRLIKEGPNGVTCDSCHKTIFVNARLEVKQT